jgi:hypothetical protein
MPQLPEISMLRVAFLGAFCAAASRFEIKKMAVANRPIERNFFMLICFNV